LRKNPDKKYLEDVYNSIKSSNEYQLLKNFRIIINKQKQNLENNKIQFDENNKSILNVFEVWTKWWKEYLSLIDIMINQEDGENNLEKVKELISE